MTKRKKIDVNITGGIQALQPGWLVRNTSTSSGGIKYERTELSSRKDGEGHENEFQTIKRVDHVKIVKEIDALVKQADYVCRTHCVATDAGWWADEDGVKAVRDGLSALARQVEPLNATAKKLGSAHRARISYVTPYLDVSSPEAAAEIARTIRETLERLIGVLRSGDIRDSKFDGKVVSRNQLRPAQLASRNLNRLAVGIPGEAIKTALAYVPIARAKIAELIDKGHAPEVAGQMVDLEPIEGAIQWFSEGGLGQW